MLIEDAVLYLANGPVRYFGRCPAPVEASPARTAIGHLVTDSRFDEGKPFSISQDLRSRHLYVLGATGSGKTNMILQLLAQDIEQGRSLALVDLRGDLVDKILLRLSSKEGDESSNRVTLLDLRDTAHIVGFNPLLSSGDPHSRAYLVRDALKAHSESWGIQLDETLRNTLIALSENELSLLEIEPMLTDSTFRKRILSKVTDPSVCAFFSRYDELSKEKQQSWYLPVLNKVTPFLGIPRLRLLFGAPNNIGLKQALDTRGQIILVALGVDRLHSAARLVGSLLIGAIESAVMSRVDTPEKSRNLVNLYIDEFETMATDAFQSIVAEGRRFRLSLTLSHQNLTQLSQSLLQVIRNNVQTQVFFQNGSEDARKLRNDLRLGEDEDPIELLQKLSVGQAYVLERPNDPVLVQFAESKDPSLSKERVLDFVEQIHQSQGSLTSEDALQCISARLQEPDPNVPGEPQDPGSGHVRHGRSPSRRPK
jgi:hypothetical protein